MLELFKENPSVVFFMIGGLCTIAAMLIGVLLIKRNNKTSSPKPTFKKTNKK